MEDIMDITVDHTATNDVAAGADSVVEAGVVVEDAAPTPGLLPPAIST